MEYWQLVYLTTWATVLIWVMFFYWWRLHTETAFYVNLLAQVLWDLKLFILLYIDVVCTFATVAMILD
jgi:hypothetical protein